MKAGIVPHEDIYSINHRIKINHCHWMVTVVNLVKETWCFAWCCLACWCGFVHAGSASGIPVSRSLAAIIVTRHRSMLAARRCRCSTGISDHFSLRAWQSSPRFRGGLSLLVIARPNSSQIWSMGLQSGDLAGCSILVMLTCWRKSRTTWTG